MDRSTVHCSSTPPPHHLLFGTRLISLEGRRDRVSMRKCIPQTQAGAVQMRPCSSWSRGEWLAVGLPAGHLTKRPGGGNLRWAAGSSEPSGR